MRKFNMSNKPATPVYLLLTLCASLLIVSCSSEEPTLEFSEEFLDNTQLTVWWASASEDAPIQVDFYNAEPNTYYKLVRSTNTDCDIQDESTCNDYKLLAELTHTMESGSQYTYYDNFISTRQYYQLYIYYPELDLNSTLPYGYIYENLPNRPNVHTTSAGNSEVYLDWDWAHGAIYYNIYYSTSSDISLSNYQGSTSTTSTEITITSLTNETSYYFIVVGVNDNGMSDYNIEGSITPSSNSPPSSPTNVTTLAGNSAVYLSWDATNNTDYYRIYYATFSGVHSSNYENFVDVSSGTSYTIDGLSNDITYYFVVYAVNPYGDSSSAEVFAVPSEDSTSLLPPSGIVATSGDGNISITWNAVSVATSYNLYVAEEGGITIDNYSNLVGGVSYSTEETSYLLDNLINGTTHYLILTAVDADGNESIASSELSATPQLPLPSDFTVAASSDLVELTWSADSELTYEIYKTTDSACDLSAHDDFSQCSDSGGSTEATFPEAQSPIADTDVTNGTLYYYWFKAYRDSEYRYADRVSALPFDYAAGINFEEATHINLFTMSGDADWYIDDVSSGANGTSNSLRSGTISDSQSSCASFVGTVQDGNLHFYYRTDSESPDVLKLYLNGSEVSNFSGGAQAWTSVQREISAGEYTLMWCYEKDGSIATNSDAVWIDEIAFDTYVARDSMSSNYLNDTGISTSLSETEQTLVSCDLDSSSPQDCNSGRDSSDETNTSSDGSSGFSFTKIDAEGNALASDAGAWICVLDNVTGLLWQNASPGEYVNFSEINLDDSESICGRTGWRLPRLEELRSIVDYSSINNFSADRDYFSELSSDSYWASTTSSNGNYLINFYSGNSLHYSSSSAYYVLVNSIEDNSYLPDAWFDSRYIDNGDGTVSDKETNLIWQRCPHGMSWQSSNNTCSGSVQSRDWHSALTAAASDSTGDHSDWRIPNIKELASIVRYTGNSSPYVNTTIFPASDVFNQYSYLWSSSPYTNGAGAEVHGYSLNSREHSTSISNTNTYPYLLVRTNPQIYPNAPYNVEVIAGDGNVSLTWGNISTATSYRIYYSTNSGAGTSSDNNVSFTADMDEDSSDFTSTYTINGLTNGTIYFFVVTAIDEEGDESSASAQVSATPALPFPDDFSATGGNVQVMLNWTVTSDIGYAVHRSTNSACDVSSDTAANDCTDYATIAYVDGESTVDDGDDIINGTTYYYWLEASRSGDASRYSSAPISAIPNVLSSNRLNDTGINGAINSDGTRSTGCSSNLTGLQDCNIGRDADQDTNSSTDGHLGFNFTKLDSSGNEMLASATTWECVRDNVTGLVWEKSSTYISVASLPTIDDSFEKCGLNKWRYPRLGELLSILNYGRDSGAMVDTDYFSNLSDSSTYYSSTAYSDNGETYGLSLSNGSTSTFLPDSNDYNYLLVTDAFNSSYLPDSWGESRYIISADGNEVSDIHTNLTWQRCVVGQAWNGSTCSGSADQLDLSNVLNAGDDEWRLPNVKELSSLAALDGGKRLNSTVFPDHIEAYHWSISNNHRNSGYLYVVNFNDSDNSSDLIGQFGWYDNVYYARLVKSVESPLPASPYGLEASAGDASATLTWSNISTATSYKMYYSETSGTSTGSDTFVDFNSSLDEDSSDSTSTYTVTGLSNGTTYYFVVTAIDGEGDESSASAQASATPVLPLPSDFAAVTTNDEVRLTWSPTVGIAYEIYKTTDSDCDLSSHNDFSQCSDSDGSAEATFPNAESPVVDQEINSGEIVYYWLKGYRDTEYGYADRISVLPTDINFEVASHLDLFTMSGNADWYIDDANGGANGTSSSLRSGVIGDNETSCASFAATAQDSILNFYYRTDSESHDKLKFYVNDSMISNLDGGTQPWTRVQQNLFAGEYILKWCYEKDGSVASNSDAVWIDEMSFESYVAPESMTSNYLNDTGITTALNSNGTLVSCDPESTTPQDCNSGRDSSDETNGSSDGSSGFSFTKINADGNALASDADTWNCVLDNITGLLWQNSSSTSSMVYSSISLDSSESICGRTGWRLPRLEELRSIVDYSSSDSASVDNAYLSQINSSYYWSSTKLGASNYVINFSDGDALTYGSSSSAYYILVNSTEENSYLPDVWFDSRYIDNGDGTISDKETNLIWQRCPHGMTWQSSGNTCSGSAQSQTWESALSAAASDTTGGDSWRLPNIKELVSIVDRASISSYYINTSIFPASDVFGEYSYFWSSSPAVSSTTGSIHVHSLNSTDQNIANYGNTYPYFLVRTNPQTYPNAPYNVEATAGDGNVSLTWGNVSTAISYRIYYSETSGTSIGSDTFVDFNSNLDEDSSDSTSTYTITGLSNGTTYFFVVTAIDAEGDESSASAQASATPSMPFPTNFRAEAGDANATLAWDPAANDDGISYGVNRSTSATCYSNGQLADGCNDSTFIADGDDNDGDTNNKITDTGLSNGTRYYYWLEAIRGTESQIGSAPISVQPSSDGGYYDFEGNLVPSDFTMSGDADWYIDNSAGANGSTASLRSGVVGGGESSCTSTTVYIDADNDDSSNELTFYYKLNTDGNNYLSLGVNTDNTDSIASSNSDWTSYSVNLTGGSDDYTITWCFVTYSWSDTSSSQGAWIDEISFTPGLILSAEQLADNYLNDTGVQFSGNALSGNNDVCSDSNMPEDPQDCDVGRDSSADTSSTIDGAAGFAFTKLDSAGYELSADASSWACVRDDVTGLIWQNSVQTSTYQDITIDDSAEICGRSGWRLPTIEELRSIVNYGSSSPAVDSSYFSAIADGHSSAEFWTSTVFNYSGSNYYWQIDFGDVGDTNKYFTNSDRYMLVTSADNPDYLLERWPNNRYSDNGDGTVTDTYTNLIWMRCSLGQDWNSSSGACDEAASSFSWSGALNQARKSSYAEYDDWRLPNVKELTSLLKHTSSSPSINSTIFPNIPTDSNTYFWTSTPSVSNTSSSWRVNLYDGTGDGTSSRSSEYYVLLVRSEESSVPAAPYGLNIEAGDQNISLDWQAISSIDDYRVYSATDSSLSIANYATLSNGTVRDVNGSTSIKIDGLSNGARHYFLVTAIDNVGTESIASPMVSATPQLPFPDDLAVGSADAALTLSWTPYADTTLGIISYNLYRSSDSNCDISAISNCAAGASFSPDSSPFTDNNDSNGLGNGLRYYYWLEASRGSGASQELRASADPVSAIPAEDDVVYHDFAGSDPEANFYSTSDSTPWYVDYSTGADGTGSSLRSGMIGDSSSSCVETYPRLDAGTLSFYYKIDSESGADKLFFYVNGSEVSTTSGGISSSSGVSGIVDWTLATYAVAFTDSYLLKWCYIKDASGESDVDAAWIDQISFPGSADSYDPENLEMPLNDTGIDWGGNSGSGNNSDCSSDMSVPQDCDQGRDADSATNDDTDGHAGFSFTRLNAGGTTYTGSGDYSKEPWHCVQDNVTGLIWEVKTNDGGLHYKDDTYNWYNTNSSTNGGFAGYANNNGGICYDYDVNSESTYCNTEAFVNRVNNVGLCGSKDWRMPDINELSSIVNLGRISPSIDTNYFPNTSSNHYWSASPSASSSGYAWRIYFYDGYDDTAFSSNNHRVRLVRSEQ